MSKSETVGGPRDQAIQEIHAERCRQIEVEGWTAEHDDAHEDGELLRAAVLYYANAKCQPDDPPITLKADGSPIGWPWHASWWKPKNARRDLIRAGALCLAERERIKRKSGNKAWVGHCDQKYELIVEALSSGLPATKNTPV